MATIALTNISFRDFAVYSCATNVSFGAQAYILDFWNLRSDFANTYDVDMGTGANMGENISFHGGSFSNAVGAAAGSCGTAPTGAWTFYMHNQSEEAYLYGVSLDYSDNFICNIRGSIHLLGDHFEGAANAFSPNVPFITVNPSMGQATVDGSGNTLSQVGWTSSHTYNEPYGGRTALISVANSINAKVSLHDTFWAASDASGNFNTTFIKSTSSNINQLPQVSSDGLYIYNPDTGSTNLLNTAPEMGQLSPVYDAGYLAAATMGTAVVANLNGWVNDNEQNLLPNSGFYGTAGPTTSMPNGTAPTSGWFGSFAMLVPQYLGVSYNSGRPQLQLRLTRAATVSMSAPYFEFVGNLTADVKAVIYDAFNFGVGVQLLSVGPGNGTMITPSNGNLTAAIGYFEKAAGGTNSTTTGPGTAVNLGPQRQFLTYTRPVNSNAGSGATATAFVNPYLQLGGAEFSSGNPVDITLGIDEPEFTLSNGNLTQGPNQVTLGTSPGGPCRIGADTSGTYGYNGGTNSLHMHCSTNPSTHFDPFYLSLPVKSGEWVLCSSWMLMPNTFSGGQIGLYYEADDASGAMLGSGLVSSLDGSGYATENGANSTGLVTATNVNSDTMDLTKITLTPGSGTIAVGDIFTVTSGTGQIQPLNKIASGSGTVWHLTNPVSSLNKLVSATISSTNVVSYTPSVGAIVAGQNLKVTSGAGTGTLPAADKILTLVGGNIILDAPPSTPLSAASLASDWVQNSGSVKIPSGATSFKLRPYSFDLVGDAYFANIEATVQ